MAQPPFATKISQAKTFLLEALKEGPRGAVELTEEANAQGISASTLARARVALKITSKRDRSSGAYVWRLRRTHAASVQAPFQLVNARGGENHDE